LRKLETIKVSVRYFTAIILVANCMATAIYIARWNDSSTQHHQHHHLYFIYL